MRFVFIACAETAAGNIQPRLAWWHLVRQDH
jgi:hypothetical protein